MTDRLKGCTVTFEQDIREDDVQPLISAICRLRGVAGVSPILSDMDDHMARQRVRSELGEAICEVWTDIVDNGGHGIKALKVAREQRKSRQEIRRLDILRETRLPCLWRAHAEDRE